MFLYFNRIMRDFNTHRTLSFHSDNLSSLFSCFAYRFAHSSTEFIMCMKLECQLKNQGFLNFGPSRISELRSSLLTIFTSPIMTCPAGLWLKGKEKQEHVRGQPFRCSISRHSRVFLVIE